MSVLLPVNIAAERIKQVTFQRLSTCQNPAMVETGKSNHEGNPVMKPTMVSSYNTHMGGVDRIDQQLDNIQSLRKSYKWYKKLALQLVIQVTLNAHKVYQIHTGNDNMTYLQFLHDTIVLLLAVTQDILIQVVSNDDTLQRLSKRHFPYIQQQAQGTTSVRPHKNCCVCTARGIKTAKGQPVKTVYICNCFPSKPGLHLDKCFEAYHSMLDYSKTE